MDNYSIRDATAADARGIAIVHVDSWRETYTGIVPQDYLDSMSYDKRTEAWQQILAGIRPSEKVVVVEDAKRNITGFAVVGDSRESSFPYNSELHAIYLVKHLHGKGLGRLLFEKCVEARHAVRSKGMFVWVLRKNPTINFYIYLGAKEFASKSIEIGGQQLEEVALGWEKI
jgi:L-amino acid N-acyltransferase YncA